MTWISEHFTLVLAIATLLAVALTVMTVRWTWRSAKDLERRPGPWLRFMGALVLALVAAMAAVFMGQGLATIGPADLAMRRMVGKPAPDLHWQELSDPAITRKLADYQGRVVLVNLWATWCPPCREEMPDLDRLQRSLGEQGLVVLHLSDEKVETLSSYLEEHPMSTEHGRVDSFPWPAAGRPTTFVVDRQGIVQRAILGSRDYEYFTSLVTRHL